MKFFKNIRFYTLSLAFVLGICAAGLEVVASRLIAPYFGTSLLVWNSVWAVIIIALAVGHYIGGRIADRDETGRRLYSVMLYTSVYMACIPFIAKYLFAVALQGINAYLIVKVIFALVLILLVLVLPFVSLGMVKPYAVKLLHNNSKDLSKSKAYGLVFMLASVGALVGFLVSTLWVTPVFGAYRCMLLLSSLFMIITVLGYENRLLLLLPILPLLLTAFLFKVKPEKDLIYETESAYNYIQVFNYDDLIVLKLNEGHAVHSFYRPNQFVYFGEWDYATVVALLNGGRSLLSLGLGCGTTVRSYAHFVPGAEVDGVEIDSVISRVAKSYFGLDAIPNLGVINQDARVYLMTTSKSYDNIVIDAYKQPYIPFHLTTKEFFQEVKRHLNPGGVVGINVSATEQDSKILLMIENTMKAVFKHVYSIRVYRSLNVHVWACDHEMDMASFCLQGADEGLDVLYRYIKQYHETVSYDPNCIVLTDDLAPVESYIERMIIDFAKKQIKK